MLFSDAPNSVRVGIFRGKNTAIRIRLVSRVTVRPVPIAL